MRKIKSLSFKELMLAWLESKPGLAKSTLAAYRGEVSRMAEYLIAKEVSDMDALSRTIWWEYLESLEGEAVGSASGRGLRHGSVQQATRITRSFLLWALEQEVIRWLPSLPEIKPKPPTTTVTSIEPGNLIHTKVAAVLAGKIKAKDLREMRVHAAFNLLFWGALKPAELVALPWEALVMNQEIILHRQDGRDPVMLPAHLGTMFEDYFRARMRSVGSALMQAAPLIAQLGNEEPLSAWSIWSIIQDWQAEYAPKAPKLTPRLLRSAYIDFLCQDGEGALQVAGSMGGIHYRVIKIQSKTIDPKVVRGSNKKIIGFLKTQARVGIT